MIDFSAAERRLASLDPGWSTTCPESAGIHVFFRYEVPAYIGETDNLSRRIGEQVFDENQGELRGNIMGIEALPNGFREQAVNDPWVQSVVSAIPANIRREDRQGIEIDLIRQYQPKCNIRHNPRHGNA